MCAQRRTQKPTGLSYGTSGEAKLVKVDANRARIEFAGGTIVNLNVVQGDIFAEDKKGEIARGTHTRVSVKSEKFQMKADSKFDE